MSRYDDYVARQRQRYGRRFSAVALAAEFRPYFDSGVRIRVRTTYSNGETYERTGTVSATTGRQPQFMLMHRSNAHGSWDLLDARDEIVAVRRHRTYEPTGGRS